MLISRTTQIFCAPSFDDKILEVVAVFGSMQMAVSRVIKLQHHRIAQVRSLRTDYITVSSFQRLKKNRCQWKDEEEKWLNRIYCPQNLINIFHITVQCNISQPLLNQETYTNNSKCHKTFSTEIMMMSSHKCTVSVRACHYLFYYMSGNRWIHRFIPVCIICHLVVKALNCSAFQYMSHVSINEQRTICNSLNEQFSHQWR